MVPTKLYRVRYDRHEYFIAASSFDDAIARFCEHMDVTSVLSLTLIVTIEQLGEVDDVYNVLETLAI
jgi:hypothetical protein